MTPGSLSLRLPATSANLGPGFDTLALALALYLEVDARAANEFSIHAEGRAPEVCAAIAGNLLLDTYVDVWRRHAPGQRAPQPLALSVRNGIPLGMGCGSSAASRLAGIALASHFGGLGWDRVRMLDEASALEHHPDNASACCLGGFVVAAYGSSVDPMAKPRRVEAVAIRPPTHWHALLVLPETPLATVASRAVLPESYARELVVSNLQNTALLVAAFAQANGGLLAAATADRMHQPFRAEVCPLLPRLLPLAGVNGILSVTLSGAGSGVLLLLAGSESVPGARRVVLEAAASPPGEPIGIAELLACGLATDPAVLVQA